MTVTVGRAAAQDQSGYGNLSATLSRFAATTGPTLTLHPGSGYITVEWTRTIVETEAPTDTVHRIEWKQQSEQWSDASSATASLQTRGHTITDLTNSEAYDVRVAVTVGENTGAWGTGSATPGPVTGGPPDLAVTARHKRLKVTWDASTDTEVDSYVVEWKTGTERLQHRTSTHRHRPHRSHLHKWIQELENDTVYVVRVTAMNGTDSAGSSVIAAHPIHAAVYIEEEIVRPIEDEFPWIRQAWDVGYGVWIDPNNGGAFAFLPGWEGGYNGVIRGLTFNYNFWTYQDRYTNYHELGHALTLDYRAPDVPGPVGIGWMYVTQLLGGHGRLCAGAGEIYPEIIAFVTGGFVGGYIVNCGRALLDGSPDPHSVATISSVLAGEIPQWFYDRYRRDDMTLDLDAVWADATAGLDKRVVAYHLRHLFGGFCSVREANWAVSSGGPNHGNIWVDGGCGWRRPRQLSVVSSGTTGLTVSWQEPLYETSPAVTHYVVQWKTGAEEYASSRQAGGGRLEQVSCRTPLLV